MIYELPSAATDMPRFSGHPDEYSAGFGSAWADSYTRFTESVTGEDIKQELDDVAELLTELVRAGRTEAIGRVVCAVMSAACYRWADREIGCTNDGSRTAAKAAAVALMLGAS